MRVLHISTYDFGGAGLAAWRIHSAMRSANMESMMLVKEKRSNDESVVLAVPNLNQYRPPKWKVLRKIKKVLRKRGRCLTSLEILEQQKNKIQAETGAFYTLPVSNYDLSDHSLVQWADIIHLHWIADFVDYPTFFQKVDKPIVWTFHDENIGYGGFHYQKTAERFSSQFGLLEEHLVDIKRKSLLDVQNIHMVALSKMMLEFYQQKALNNTFPVSIIHNGFSSSDFAPRNKNAAREVLGISSDATVFVFCSAFLNEERKGLKKLIRTLEGLSIPNCTLLCIGSGEKPVGGIDIIAIGQVANQRLMSMLYSAGDYFVMPSEQEAFAQTPIEALACGLPVILFPVSGTEELINDSNGVRCSGFDIESLAEGIKTAMSRVYDKTWIRNDAVKRFDIGTIVSQYIKLYKELV
jgi:glycosyltransferase involved in cell wall biosynthesis